MNTVLLRIAAASMALAGLWIGASPSKAFTKDAFWHFSKIDERNGVFGLLTPENVLEFTNLSGDCRPIKLRIPFKPETLAELVRMDGAPQVRFLTDAEKQDFPIEGLGVHLCCGALWTAELKELPRGLFEKMAAAKQASVQLFAYDSSGKEKIFATYGPLPVRERKKVISHVVETCF